MGLIMEATQKVMTEYGRITLKYEMTEYSFDKDEEEGTYYGIRIIQMKEKEFYDECTMKGVTENEAEARKLFEQLVSGLVMPVTLCEILDDWQSAKELLDQTFCRVI